MTLIPDRRGPLKNVEKVGVEPCGCCRDFGFYYNCPDDHCSQVLVKGLKVAQKETDCKVEHQGAVGQEHQPCEEDGFFANAPVDGPYKQQQARDGDQLEVRVIRGWQQQVYDGVYFDVSLA